MPGTPHFPMPETDGCYFCDIVAGASNQWQIITSDELTMTLLNGRQFEIGQCMVIPRRHAPTLLDLEVGEQGAVMAAAKHVAGAMVDAFQPDGILLYQNNGSGSGQEVPHFHLHVVPRQPGSDWGLGPPHLERLEKEGRLRKDDHSVVTDAKQATVDLLRRHVR